MDNTQLAVPKVFKAGDFLVPDVDLDKGRIFSAIKVLSVDEKGYKCKRINYYYEGEEFFMAKDAMSKSRWVLVKENSQLPLL